MQRLKEEQQAIVKQDIEVKQLIQQIWNCESDEQLNELNVRITRQVQSHKDAIDQYERSIANLKKPSERESLLAEIDAYRNQVESNYISLRKANLNCRRVIDEKAKQSLFASNEHITESDGLRQRRKATDKQQVLNKTLSVTENLQAVSRMMAEQVAQSQNSLQTLINSSAVVTETREEFKMMNAVISQSKKLLEKYGRRETTDKVLIILALAFFFASVLYVITKRLF
ncbi:vesicle transport protein SEC20-like protein [Dinothrombium tinctorium]|uniref:Vesicle transport protein SEC20-like protein n=1 Tax=Dinothrombium tinctorium TaxID=1965070 RepID=A0A3S3PGM9_9ACAR|nr:vesicle transport protein SEC20-like protein [Dinothrombium tinctorium]RWS14089.1 vesicle transport protein SEC20-like protein [Dinothrombium tinctorium]RWS14818.1 vesicle transport protein SEC20-like protein [Dinothrombium tinctorium]RWS14860.1 vesicle transport protein SEC20-like protein [Dinothrombium tinctorium]